MPNKKTSQPKQVKPLDPVTATLGDYQGRPTITLTRGKGDRYPFTFGLSKGKKIIEVYAEVQKFVADNEAKP